MAFREIVLDLPYNSWKTIVQGGNLNTAYETTQRANRNTIYAGNGEQVLRALVAGSDYTDWNTNFQSTAILVGNEDEAIAVLAKPPILETTADGYLSVEATFSDNDSWKLSSVPGKDMRYEKQGNVDLPSVGNPHATVYEITENSVFYKMVFQLDSDNIYIQVEIDGQEIFPAGNGLLFEDLESLCLGGSGGNYSSDYGGGGKGEMFGLYQYDSNKWIWEPPKPLHIESNMKIKMKASSTSTSKDYLKGIAIRRTLV